MTQVDYSLKPRIKRHRHELLTETEWRTRPGLYISEHIAQRITERHMQRDIPIIGALRGPNKESGNYGFYTVPETESSLILLVALLKAIDKLPTVASVGPQSTHRKTHSATRGTNNRLY